MKKTLTTRFGFVLLLAASLTTISVAAQIKSDTTLIPEQLTLTFELQDLPGGNLAGSFWEVSYEWRIADRRDFLKWSLNGEDPAAQDSVGILLSKGSFTRPNLASPDNRRFATLVPVNGELLERLRNGDKKPQIVWLDASVRIYDAKLGAEVIKKVNPAWGPHFYRVGAANVRMELTRDGKVTWYTQDTPPWLQGKQHKLSVSRNPPPR